ncbi:hypothetical protein [Thalassospira alkalitolerans]|uniref:Peptidase M41 domain-containing protein n=1 Tax=Thalassospira alkalitolerans TaxID=1293890 RepID=A0A1Y2L8L9_9PROT|nr:hypothetical protein [Thalassospira alkalitolerans]OSQ45658.1 hypothetical protein TALK_17225 [Thalassospira alkalitolerans]
MKFKKFGFAGKATIKSVAGLLICVLLIAGILVVFKKIDDPTDDFSKTLFGYLLLFPAFLFLTQLLFPFSLSVRSWLAGMLFIACSMWLASAFGGATYHYFSQNPAELAALASAFALCCLGAIIAFFFGKLTNPLAWNIQNFVLPSFSKRDNETVAIHEAGHAMMFAAVDEIPGYVEIIAKPSEFGLGATVGTGLKHQAAASNEYQWAMLCCLAGQAAEKFKLGIIHDGSQQSYEHWMDAAKRFLSQQPGQIFYPAPTNTLEIEHNNQALCELRERHLSLLEQYFSLNSAVFDSLCETLHKQKHVKAGKLRKLLAPVQLPDGFPTIVLSNMKI